MSYELLSARSFYFNVPALVRILFLPGGIRRGLSVLSTDQQRKSSASYAL